MKKIYLLGFASMFALAVNAQTTMLVKNPLKKRTSATERTIAGPNSVTQVASTIVCNTQYVAGTTMDLNFTFTMSNTDGEYGDFLAITFPAGIVPTGVGNTSNPFPNTEDAGGGLEALNGVTGQLISWGVDNDDAYGGIFSTTGITFTVEATIAPGTTGNLVASYDLLGDKYASTVGGVDGDQLGANFTIYEAGAAVINLTTTFVQPLNLNSLNTCSYGLDTIIGQIKNLGTTTETNVTVACTVNGVAQTPFVVASIAPGDSAYVAYLPAYDFNASTDYTLKAYVAVASDIDLTNDTASLVFNNALTTDLTSTNYSNGCEAGFQFNSLNRAFVSGDGYIFGPSTATVQSGTQALFYTVPNTATAGVHEAMVVLPCTDVTIGDVYRITFWKRINGTAAASNGQTGVFTGLANDAAAMTTILKPYTAIAPYATWIKDSVDYTATATETRYFALGGTGAVVAGTNQINVRYDNINIVKVPAIGVKENAAVEAISVFPNPNNGTFTIRAIENNSSVAVYSIIGENVYSSNLVKGSNSVDLSNLAAGSYIVKVTSGSQIISKRVVINK